MKALDIMEQVFPLRLEELLRGAASSPVPSGSDWQPVVNASGKVVGVLSTELLPLLQRHPEESAAVLERTFLCLNEHDEIPFDGARYIIVLNAEGAACGKIFMDTALRHELGQMRFRRRLYHEVLDALESGITAVDEKGVITFANQTASVLLGYSRPDELEGRIVEDAIPGTRMRFVLATRKPLRWGTLLVGNRTLVACYAPIIRNGQLRGVASCFHDISVFDKIHAELRQLKDILKEMNAVIESTYDGLSITDRNGTVLRINNAYERMTGIKGADIVGQNMSAMVDGGMYDQSVSSLVLKAKKAVTINQVINGRRFLVTGSPVLDDDGEILRIVTNLRDITELTTLQHEREDSRKKMRRYRSRLDELEKGRTGNDNLVYCSKAMERVAELASVVAAVDSTVLITGESGTGKDLVARRIHRLGGGKQRPFIKINCAALPDNLLESELFGYEAGAFTGAGSKGKPGMFELADGGSLFMDEIAEIPLYLQAKLLRALQDQEIMRVGGTSPKKVKVRIIAATNRDLGQLVAEKTFREDLYYRLMVVPIHIPPLRERVEDIPALISHFLEKYNDKFEFSKTISGETIDLMLRHSWPGNVRELENVIERMMVLCKENELSIRHLPESIRSNRSAPSASTLKAGVEQLEAHMLAEAFLKYGSWGKAALALGINTATVYRKAGKYGLIKKF